MKRYTLETWRDGKSRWGATCRVTEYVDGSGVLSVGTGNGTGVNPIDASHDAMISAELNMYPEKSDGELREAVGSWSG